MKDSRFSIRLPDLDAKLIEKIASKQMIDKSLLLRFCITSSIKLARKPPPKEFINPELAFLIEAMPKG